MKAAAVKPLKQERRREIDISRYLASPGVEAGDLRGVGWAVAVSLFLHIMFFWMIPWEITRSPVAERPVIREVEYVYEDALPEPVEERFVETNPDVPTNAPDETANFSNRDQQAGQEEASDEGPDDMPFLDGEEEFSSKIIDGTFQDSQPFPEALAQQESVEQQERNPAVPYLPPPQPMGPDFIEQDTVLLEEGIASMADAPNMGEAEVEDPLRASDIPLTVTSVEPFLAPNVEPPSPEETSVAQPQQPRPRPRVASPVLPGPIMQSSGRAPVMDHIAVSAKFSEFGDYLARMFDAIGTQFQILAYQSQAVRAEVNSMVLVKFKLTREGEIKDLVVGYTTAGRMATLVVQDSIQSPAPFGPWTEDMMAILSEEEPFGITFYYR